MTDNRSLAHQWADLYWEERYGYPLSEWVQDRRDRGAKWRQVAREITDVTGVEMNHATMTSWFPTLRTKSTDAA